MIELQVVHNIDLAAVRAAGPRLEPNVLKLATHVYGMRPAGTP